MNTSQPVKTHMGLKASRRLGNTAIYVLLIAISVVAEMMAVKNNRDGGFSRDKKRHDMFPDIV